MSKPVVVLNSGGFDSTVLLNCVAHCTADRGKVYSLFFDYGQRSLRWERKCAQKMCCKLGVNHLEVKLPQFWWTNSKFYKPGYDGAKTQYLEMRNLVFLSYAASIAESRGADTIYMALLYLYWDYPDCSKTFVRRMNEVLSPISVRVKAPFITYDKAELAKYALRYNISREDFHSCDNPDSEGHPCGTCLDCIDINNIYGRKYQ